MKSVQSTKREKSAVTLYTQALNERDTLRRAKASAEIAFNFADADLRKIKARLAAVAETHKFAQATLANATRACLAADDKVAKAFAAIPPATTNQKVA